jgi:peptidase M50B-like protein
VAGVVALVTVVEDRVWRRARHVVTIAHEGGHALAALVTGRRLAGVRLHSDTSGVTISAGRPTGPGVVLTVAAGYVTPSLLGLGAAALLASGRVSLLLQLFVALLIAILVVIRNGFGAVSVLVTMAIVLAVSWFASPTVQGGFAAYVSWFLLVGGVRPVIEVQRHRRRGQGLDSDPEQLARLTRLPALFWVAVFGLVTVGCLAIGARLVV